jgi:two-component system chemotaxis response regulator CheB
MSDDKNNHINGHEQYYRLNNQVFLLAMNDDNESIAITAGSLQGKKLEDFIARAKESLGGEKFIFKIVGPLSIINRASKILSPYAKDIKTVQRTGDFEVLYFPADGRLRVSKSIEADVNKDIKDVIKVLVVDDSKTMRTLLCRMMQDDDKIEVVAMAEKPSEVEKLIEEYKPDVVTLDIHMPEMTGVELFNEIGPKYKIPTIMITSLSLEDGPLVVEALENGAFDYIQKPEAEKIAEVGPILIEKIKQAALSKMFVNTFTNSQNVKQVTGKFNQDSLVVIGSSTGGTHTLKDILTNLPEEIPPILIVQHIPPVFSKAFADRMNGLCPFKVKEAEDGEMVEPGKVLIAPGGKQMRAIRMGDTVKVEVNDDPPLNRFKPSVDYLFSSVRQVMKTRHVVAVILTGMGRDGAAEMLNLKNAGACTIAQSEESCVVFGMPKEAIALGAIDNIEHTIDIPARIADLSWPGTCESKENEDDEEAS